MDAAVRVLLACPSCGSALGADWCCEKHGTRYGAPDGIPDLRLAGDEQTEAVRAFYAEAPFPGYPANADRNWLRQRAGRSRFAQLLDDAIPADARIAELGCGTGQMSLYLARADRVVIGADLTRASLLLAANAARSFALHGVHFIETDLTRPGLRSGAFDVVYCSGVLHHTPDPRRSFARVAELVRPGGMIVLGLYNAFARLPLLVRRALWNATARRSPPRDAVLRDRASQPERRAAWLRDQYCHPLEHSHTIAEVRGWFRENGVEFVRTYPSALLAHEEAGLFDAEPGGWRGEEWLAQISWMRSLGAEGGLFVIVGRRGEALPEGARA